MLHPSFYYEPNMRVLRIWLLTDGAFLTLFTIGSVLFAIVVFRMTRATAAVATAE